MASLACLARAALLVWLAGATLTGCRKQESSVPAPPPAPVQAQPTPAVAPEPKPRPSFDAFSPPLDLSLGQLIAQFEGCRSEPELPVTLTALTGLVPIYPELFRDKNGHLASDKAIDIENKMLDPLDFERAILSCNGKEAEVITDKQGYIYFFAHTYEVRAQNLRAALDLAQRNEPKPCEATGPTQESTLVDGNRRRPGLIRSCDAGPLRWTHLVVASGKQRQRIVRTAMVREKWETHLTEAPPTLDPEDAR